MALFDELKGNNPEYDKLCKEEELKLAKESYEYARKALEILAIATASISGSCPYDWQSKEKDCCKDCKDLLKECWVEWAYSQIDEEEK